MPLEDEMRNTAIVHHQYLLDLVEAGFDRREAFELVRDHHATFCWVAHVSEEAPPGWLANRTSSESSPSTAPELRILRPDTTPQ